MGEAGAGVHDAPLPGPGGHQRAHDRRDGPQVGHRRAQGERDQDRQAARRRQGLVDIRTTGGPASAQEKAAVDSVLGEPTSLWEGGERRPADDHVGFGGAAARSQRPQLLPVLHAIQDRVGWVSRGALEYACRRLAIPPAEAYGVVSFYGRFALEERPALALHVCDDIACKCAGADELCAALEKSVGPAGKQWQRSACLGLCDRAPAALVERAGATHEELQISPMQLAAVQGVFACWSWPTPPPPPPPRGRGGGGKLLRRIGVAAPQLDRCIWGPGGFAALRAVAGDVKGGRRPRRPQ